MKLRVPVPELVRVKGCGVLAVPCCWDEKVKLEGLNDAAPTAEEADVPPPCTVQVLVAVHP